MVFANVGPFEEKIFFDEGENNTLMPNSIFIIAKTENIGDLRQSKFPIDEWATLLSHLKSYRWKYKFLYAPLIYANQLMKISKRKLLGYMDIFPLREILRKRNLLSASIPKRNYRLMLKR